MTDIVARLREANISGWYSREREAADEIERLRAEKEALEAAMPSEGADAALAYAAEKSARERAEAALRECVWHADAMWRRIEWYAEEGWVNKDIPEANSYHAWRAER